MGTSRREGLLAEATLKIKQQLAKFPGSLVVILGPTASGKTQLALDLAELFPLEIVSADSRLLFQELNIGTAKPSIEEQARVNHHLLDRVSPDQSFTLADYQRAAFEVIDQLLLANKLPLLVGGTMLYIDAVVYNYALPQQGDLPIVSFRSWPLEKLQSELKSLRSDAEQFLDWQNPVRLTRALEYHALTGEWIWEKKKKNESRYPYLLLGLQVEKATLKKRITERIENQIQQGLIDEVKTLLQKYPDATTAMTGIGYRQVLPYLKGEYSIEEMKNQIIHDTLAYAKRQMTWWRRNREIIWLPVVD